MSVVDLVFPLRCARCGRSGASPCGPCIADLRPVGCIELDAPVDVAAAAVAYDAVATPFIAELKRRGTRATARWFAAAIAMTLDRLGERPDIVTWVPAAPHRLRQRGFDQGVVLARAVGRATGVSVASLVRRRGGPAQTGRARADRLAGPQIRPRNGSVHRQVLGATVLVVDDVVTTGASMGAVATVLRELGANRIVAGAAAHRL